MDPRERWNDQEEATRMAVDRHLGTVWTALPVKITEDSEGHICKPQPTVKGWERDKEGQMKSVEMPNLGGEVPVQFAGGGGFVITHPVKQDDEGIAIFASRSIDGWWDKGGVQEEPSRRRHSLSDAMYIPGIRSKPNKLGEKEAKNGNGNGAANGNGETKKTKAASTTSIQIRTEDGDYYIELTEEDVNIVCKNCTVTAEENVIVKCKNADVTAEESVKVTCKDATVNASDQVTLDTPKVKITGDVEVDGNVTVRGDVKAGAVSLRQHIHMRTQAHATQMSGPPLGG